MKTALKEAADVYPSYMSTPHMDNNDGVKYFPLPNPGRRRDMDEQGRLPFSLKKRKPSRDKWTLIITIAALLATILFLLVAFLTVARRSKLKKLSESRQYPVSCKDECRLKVAETIPDGLEFSGPTNGAIVDEWHTLLDKAVRTIDIASSYWTLRDRDIPGGPYTKYSKVGEAIYQKLVKIATQKGVKVRIVQQVPSATFPQNDTKLLGKVKNIEVRSLDVSRLGNNSGGIIHTKMWIVDNQHIYLGSANMDWRALTQVKEIGLLTYNCSCVANDMAKIFSAYWMLAKKDSFIPQPWPVKYNTVYNIDTPLELVTANAKVFIGSSPASFCPKNRTDDLDAILYVIKQAKRFIYVSVMDYDPVILYGHPERYWGVIDNALRSAAYDRGVTVRLLASKWKHTPKIQQYFLKSLQAMNGAAVLRNGSIEVKNFIVPPGSMEIPFSRVNHDKYMVTDSAAYIGTSNWVGDYFVNTAGVSYVISQSSVAGKTKPSNSIIVQDALRQVFERDWDSKYAHAVG